MSILDEIEFGTRCTFDEYVGVWKQDAERQEALVNVASQILDQECRKNDLQHLTGYPSRVTVFHSSRPPSMTTRQYVERIAAFSGCSPCCLIIAMKYLQDSAKQDTAFLLDSLNGHRLILTAVMVAAKFLDDFYYSNGYWAKVGGISISELNGLEMEFLFLMKFTLHIKRSEYDEFLISVLKLSNEYDEIARKQQTHSSMGVRRAVEAFPPDPANGAKAPPALATMGRSSSLRRIPDGKLEPHSGAMLAHPSMRYSYGVLPDRKTSPATGIATFPGNIPC